MRCLTLAEALRAKGAQCYFISRAHAGHLLELIYQRDFAITVLPVEPSPKSIDSQVASERSKDPAHAPWLGCDWQIDAEQTHAIMETLHPDWLVVDHYALDQRWEVALRPYCQKLMVIDDLADRPHQCDMLLDQNLGRQLQDYSSLVPTKCKVLIGPQYALLRPEFAGLRLYSLQRRQQPAFKKLLITMGGVDQNNATGQVLQALQSCNLPQACRIRVVMGPNAPWLQQVRAIAEGMPWQTEVLVNINNMAQTMADSDLAVGAAGSTSWERCCLGLPTLIVVLADNQRLSAQALKDANAAFLIGDMNDIYEKLPLAINASMIRYRLQQMIAATNSISDGRGVDKVLSIMGVANDQA